MDRLLKLLNENARYDLSELATMTGLSEEAVTAKIAEYEQKGIVKGYQAIIDWDRTERELVSSLIEIKVTPKRDSGFEETAGIIAQFEEVDSVYLMSGSSYDLAAIVTGRTFKEISDFVAKKLSPLDGVVSTATHFMMRKYKDRGLVFDIEEVDERGLASF